MSLGASILDASAAPAPVPATAPVEGAPTTDSPEGKTIDVKNPSFDLLSKLERKLKMREEEFKSKEQKMAEYEAKLKEFEGFEENPLAVLKRKGFDIEKINKLALETLDEEDLDPVSRRFKQIEETLAKKDQEYEAKMKEAIAAKEKELQERENQYQIEVFKRDLRAHLASKKDEYEVVNSHPDGPELVYDVIFEDLQRRAAAGQQDLSPMDYDTAASKVEEYLYNELQKYLSLNKVKSKFVGEEQDWGKLLNKESSKTITNDLTPRSSIRPEELSEKERIQAAIEGIKTGRWNV